MSSCSVAEGSDDYLYFVYCGDRHFQALLGTNEVRDVTDLDACVNNDVPPRADLLEEWRAILAITDIAELNRGFQAFADKYGECEQLKQFEQIVMPDS